ncbi:AAA family ATPase [Mycobacterium avium]|uniref:AAA family ATPase n=1 Tax=Mycobacterium avium TaxID=1764 RepID=UPI001CC36CBD|nr:AAA family ATPase [Mycobacterium avium]MBZ4618825.1 AAA family ATPase [Mycobacterium avium subsp. hominissuis]
MSTAETDITDHPITDKDLAGIDESLHDTVREIYAATGHREFALIVARNAERQLTDPELQFALLLNVIDAAIDSGISHDVWAEGYSVVATLSQLFPGTDVTRTWYELETQLAKLSDLPPLPRDFYNQTRIAVRIGQYAYAATGNSAFAIALAGAFQTKTTKSWNPGLWSVIQSAITAGADLDTRIRCAELRWLLRDLGGPDEDISAKWSEVEAKLAKEARHAEIVRTLAAEFDEDEKDFSPFFGRYLNWFDKNDDRMQGRVEEFIKLADDECLAMDDVVDALKRHVGLPGSIVAAAFDEFNSKKLQEERRQKLLGIKKNYGTEGQFGGLIAGVRRMSWAASGSTSAPPAIWGEGNEVLWADGESLIVEASYGVGKTTLAGLLVRGMLYGEEVLGYPVRPLTDRQRILYLALDRPDQIVRSMLRQFTHEQLDEIDTRLCVWEGPLPADAAENEHLLCDLADIHEVDVIFVDSVKDAALGLSEDRAAAIYQCGRQRLLQSGRQLVELHHLTKGGDAYGSIWLSAGVGSVVRLKGDAGGSKAVLTHLKSPARRIDPIQIVHDRANGDMTVASQASDEGAAPAPIEETAARGLADWVAEHGEHGVTAKQLVEHQGGDASSEAALVRAKRTLNALVGDDGRLRRIDGNGRGNPTRWAVSQ